MNDNIHLFNDIESVEIPTNPQTPKISVIVPVYKVEKYLPQCIESILNQTFTDFELLLIDDGSPDRSSIICDEYAAKDARIRVFHKENGGVSSARNLGFDNARGEWISFVDSDDWIETNFLEYLYFNAIKFGSDISICTYLIDNNDRIDIPHKLCGYHNDLSNLISSFMGKRDSESSLLMATVCCCLIKKETTDNIRFKNYLFCEDKLYLISLLHTFASAFVGNAHLYHYRSNNQSATRVFSDLYSQSFYGVQKDLEFILDEHKTKDRYYNEYIYSSFFLFFLLCLNESVKLKFRYKNAHKYYKDFNLRMHFRSVGYCDKKPYLFFWFIFSFNQIDLAIASLYFKRKVSLLLSMFGK